MGSNLRNAVYPGLIGVAVGVLLTGLVLPMAVNDGERDAAVLGAGGNAPTAGSSTNADAAITGPDTESGGQGGVAPGPTAARPPAGSRAASASLGRPVEGSAAGGARTASEVGVSAEQVRVGVAIFDLGNVGRLGLGAPGASAPEQRSFWEAFFTEVNERGGVHGRKIDARYVEYDALSRDDAIRACVELTEDVKPFLVLAAGGISGDSALCITEQHATPLLSSAAQGEPEEYYARSAGRLISRSMAAERMARAMARRADEQGRLRNVTIGVLSSSAATSRLPTDRALIPELKALGHSIAHVTRLSEDLHTAQSQIPVEVMEMRRKGVEVILSTLDPVTTPVWLNQAESQGYRPRYLFSDVATASHDFTVQAAPASMDGTAYTSGRAGEARAGLPEQPEAADCRVRYQRRTGQNLDRNNSAGYGQMIGTCGAVDLFIRATTAAGPALTRNGWLAAIAGIRDMPSAGMGGTLTFGPLKFDGGDFVRTKRFQGDCRCFVPVDDFTRVP